MRKLPLAGCCIVWVLTAALARGAFAAEFGRPQGIRKYAAAIRHESPDGEQPPADSPPPPGLAVPTTILGLVTRTNLSLPGVARGDRLVELTASQGYTMLVDLGQGAQARRAEELLGPIVQVTGHARTLGGRAVFYADVIRVAHQGPTDAPPRRD